MKVRNAMATAISTASPYDSIETVAVLMRDRDCGFIPIVDGDLVVGVVTDRDIVIRCLAGGHGDCRHAHVQDVMSSPVWMIDAEVPLEDAAHEMAAHGVRRLPVTHDGQLVGVLSYGDLEQALHAEGSAATEATLGVT